MPDGCPGGTESQSPSRGHVAGGSGGHGGAAHEAERGHLRMDGQKLLHQLLVRLRRILQLNFGISSVHGLTFH